MSSMKRKYFTAEEANRSLPLVKRIISNVIDSHERAVALSERIDQCKSVRSALEPQIDLVLAELQSYVDELTQIGVELKDYEKGMVDFPARHEARDIYLCWQFGEETVAHWHELHGGFADRQPVIAGSLRRLSTNSK